MLLVHPDGAVVRERALRTLDRLPPFSPILNRLLATMAKEDVSYSELADLIEKDSVLAGNVLRLVNSALYNLRGEVSSVRHAVAVLGLNKLRNVGLSLSVARVWGQAPSPAGWPAARFNLHSVAAGILADLLAGEVETDYPEGAFVAGLLHDLGKLLIAIAAPDEFAAVRTMAQASGRDWSECEAQVLGITHAELSGHALERWNLPPPIREAVIRHHTPEGEGRLSSVLAEANAAANALGYSIVERPEREVSERVAPLTDQFAVEFEAMKKFF
jgi:HD-like signal output (HDOD) protein